MTPRHVMQNGQLRSTEACDPSKMANCSGVCSSLARAACNVFFGPFLFWSNRNERITEFHRQPFPYGGYSNRIISYHHYKIWYWSAIGPVLHEPTRASSWARCSSNKLTLSCDFSTIFSSRPTWQWDPQKHTAQVSAP